MFLIDTHTHLDQFPELDAVLARADAAGVISILTLAVDLATCRRNLEIAAVCQRPRIYLGLGIHPGEARIDELAPCLDLMRENAAKIALVGEIGLDFTYPWARKDEQKKAEQRQVYKAMLAFAVEHDLPVSIHARGKWKECFETAAEMGVKRAVFHWYSGPNDVLEKILERGFFVSFTPSLAYSADTQRVALATPIEQSLVETDCPVRYRDRETGDNLTSEPKDVFRSFELFCELKNLDLQSTAEVLNKNALWFVSK
ncbi:MAG: TatD family hydrolase [Candidatus Omnitrophica bacterium]|nr:TatD family hydrolase [Candidatus Omnitrophota bacterium]